MTTNNSESNNSNNTSTATSIHTTIDPNNTTSASTHCHYPYTYDYNTPLPPYARFSVLLSEAYRREVAQVHTLVQSCMVPAEYGGCLLRDLRGAYGSLLRELKLILKPESNSNNNNNGGVENNTENSDTMNMITPPPTAEVLAYWNQLIASVLPWSSSILCVELDAAHTQALPYIASGCVSVGASGCLVMQSLHAAPFCAMRKACSIEQKLAVIEEANRRLRGHFENSTMCGDNNGDNNTSMDYNMNMTLTSTDTTIPTTDSAAIISEHTTTDNTLTTTEAKSIPPYTEELEGGMSSHEGDSTDDEATSDHTSIRAEEPVIVLPPALAC